MYLNCISCLDDIFLNKIFCWLKRKIICSIRMNFQYICLIKIKNTTKANIDSF